jgi:acyl-[acyl-carrier-protein]-phospholipid O-acyltransferase / long-chain-fatty-acid--[acyl-carrier-protein] ligase
MSSEVPAAGGGLRLSSRGFQAYLATQCVSALTDNAYKFLLLGFLSARAAGSLSSFGDESALTQALFAAPFVLLAPWAGVLADRVRKSTLLVVAMASELVFMLATGPAFATGSLTVLLGLVALSSIQSTFFSPAKYGFLPEMVPESELTRANGLVNMTTFAAIIVGQVVGGVLYDGFRDDLTQVSWPLGVIGAAGFLAALAVPKTPAGQPGLTFRRALRELHDTARESLRNRGLAYTLLGIGHFFMLAAVLQLSLVAYGEHALGLDATGRAAFVALALLGIALGSLLAAAWSGRHIELGLVPLGALGTSFFLFLLAAVPTLPVAQDGGLLDQLLAGLPACLCVLGLGASAGLFSVPLNANLQLLAPEGAKGRFLAFGNMVSFVGIFLAAGGWLVLAQSGLDVRGQALAIGIFSLAGTVVSFILLPEACLRLVAWLLAHSIYRIRVLHVDRIPEHGGALLVANHVSWVDWLILSVITRRKVRFLIQRQYYEWPPIHWLLEMAGCIPVASGDSPDVVAASLAKAGEQLEQGHVVGIFAEGTITRTGTMQTIRRGYQRIVMGRGVPIIPIYLDGLWGSVFSHEGGKFMRHFPRHIPYPVTVVVGEPLPSRAEPWHIRAALQRLSSEAWEDRRASRRPLHVTLLREARRGGRVALLEPGRRGLSRAALLSRALALRGALRRHLGSAPRAGVLLPHGLDESVAVLSLLCAGRVPVPLSLTATDDDLAQALQRAGADVVLTSPELAGRLRAPVRAVDVAACLHPDGARARPLRRAARRWRVLLWLLPTRLAQRLVSHADEAVLLFSAGATGRPKAVPLGHHQVLCNVEAARELLPLGERDTLLSLLPTSLATGYSQLFWLPLLTDVRAVLLPDPLDGRVVGQTVVRENVTVLIATPRLLEHYLRTVKSERFGSLRLVIVMGETLRPALRLAFEERFGLRPLEALTSTECAGFVTLSTPDVRSAGHFQRGARPGSVGHPLPGVSLEIIDPNTGELSAAGEPGVLRMRGPCVARGYLDDPALQARAFRDDWYVSGDEAVTDEDGFITITGRFARVTTVNGQRVSHAALEDILAAQLGTPDAPLAVVDVPDGAAGTRLAVCYARGALQPARVVQALRAAGLAGPWLPGEEDFVELDALPLLPTGTVDFTALRRAVLGRRT